MLGEITMITYVEQIGLGIAGSLLVIFFWRTVLWAAEQRTKRTERRSMVKYLQSRHQRLHEALNRAGQGMSDERDEALLRYETGIARNGKWDDIH